MAQKTPEQILESILGPRPVVGGVELLGPNEGRLLDEITCRVEVGLSDFSIRWGDRARTMPREILASAALAAMVEGKRGAKPRAPRSKPPVDVRSFVHGF